MSRRCSYSVKAMKGEGRSLISDKIHGQCRFFGRNRRVSRKSNKRKVKRGNIRKERNLIKDKIHTWWRCYRRNRRISK